MESCTLHSILLCLVQVIYWLNQLNLRLKGPCLIQLCCNMQSWNLETQRYSSLQIFMKIDLLHDKIHSFFLLMPVMTCPFSNALGPINYFWNFEAIATCKWSLSIQTWCNIDMDISSYSCHSSLLSHRKLQVTMT